jgi:natural product precursor
MKSKKFDKKFVLNKKTIADLNSKEMKDVFGGEITASCGGSCISCVPCTITHTGMPKCADC